MAVFRLLKMFFYFVLSSASFVVAALGISLVRACQNDSRVRQKAQGRRCTAARGMPGIDA
jgi:hypothetical protein